MVFEQKMDPHTFDFGWNFWFGEVKSGSGWARVLPRWMRFTNTVVWTPCRTGFLGLFAPSWSFSECLFCFECSTVWLLLWIKMRITLLECFFNLAVSIRWCDGHRSQVGLAQGRAIRFPGIHIDVDMLLRWARGYRSWCHFFCCPKIPVRSIMAPVRYRP